MNLMEGSMKEFLLKFIDESLFSPEVSPGVAPGVITRSAAALKRRREETVVGQLTGDTKVERAGRFNNPRKNE
jgi:hypothetical protein